MADKPSVILMGSKPGGAVALEILLRRGWDVRCVVTSRKSKHPFVGGPTLVDVADARGIPIVGQSKLTEQQRADFVISYMYRKRVRAPALALANRAAVNFHAGALPEFGGWAFYNVAILEGATEYGCTCHYMDEGFDTGPLLRVRRFAIDPRAHTAVSLERRAQQEMIRLFRQFCVLAESGDDLPVEVQDPARMRYMNQPEFEALKEIPSDADPETVDRIARAFWYPPYRCAWTRLGDIQVEVVPQLAKDQAAEQLHRDDYSTLESVAWEALSDE